MICVSRVPLPRTWPSRHETAGDSTCSQANNTGSGWIASLLDESRCFGKFQKFNQSVGDRFLDRLMTVAILIL